MADEPMSTPGTPPAAPPGAWGKPAEPVPGTAGFVYADVPDRIFALVIDVIVLAVIGVVVGALLAAIVGPVYRVDLDVQDRDFGVETNYLALVLNLAATMAVSAAYWIYCWTKLRGSVGQKALGMQVGNVHTGAQPDPCGAARSPASRRASPVSRGRGTGRRAPG